MSIAVFDSARNGDGAPVVGAHGGAPTASNFIQHDFLGGTMHIINIDHVTINHAGRVIFEDLTWAIGDRDRVGLVGPNGAGKSSLLKAIVDEVIPDSGSIVLLR